MHHLTPRRGLVAAGLSGLLALAAVCVPAGAQAATVPDPQAQLTSFTAPATADVGDAVRATITVKGTDFGTPVVAAVYGWFDEPGDGAVCADDATTEPDVTLYEQIDSAGTYQTDELTVPAEGTVQWRAGLYFGEDAEQWVITPCGDVRTVTANATVPAAHVVSDADLTAQTKGGITVTGAMHPGGVLTVAFTDNHRGAKVTPYVFSTPVSLGTATVPSTNAVVVALPSTITLGAHRLAVYSSTGAVLGWADITVTAAPGGVQLATTGSSDAPIAWVAVALVLAGAGLVVVVRRRRRA